MKTYVNLKEIDDVYVTDEFRNKDLVSVEELLDKISELAAKVEELEDDLKEAKREYQDLEDDLEDNYRPIPLKEMYGISDKDFI
jgi:chromosome segregation ATPase